MGTSYLMSKKLEKSTPQMIVSDKVKYDLILSGKASRAEIQSPPYIYFADTRDPTSDEPDINPVIYWAFWWINLATGDIFDCTSPVAGNYYWTKRINNVNIISILNMIVPGIVSSILQSTLPSLLTSLLPAILPTLHVFPQENRQRTIISYIAGTSRKPNDDRDVEVSINLKFSTVLSLNASATIQFSQDGTTWNTGPTDSKNIILTSNFTDPVTGFTVPMGTYYRILLSGTGISIDQVSELLV